LGSEPSDFRAADRGRSKPPSFQAKIFPFVLAVGRAILTFEASALRLFYRAPRG
jgi:hypothetical protein